MTSPIPLEEALRKIIREELAFQGEITLAWSQHMVGLEDRVCTNILALIQTVCERVIGKDWIHEPTEEIPCPMNPPGEDFKHIISKGSGSEVICYQCGRTYEMAVPNGNIEAKRAQRQTLKDIISGKIKL